MCAGYVLAGRYVGIDYRLGLRWMSKLFESSSPIRPCGKNVLLKRSAPCHADETIADSNVPRSRLSKSHDWAAWGRRAF